MNRALRLALLSVAAVGMASCATDTETIRTGETGYNAGHYRHAAARDDAAARDRDFQRLHAASTDLYYAVDVSVDQILRQLQRRNQPLERPLIVATPQNIDDLSRASSFGLTLGELVQARFVERGYQVIEVKAREQMQVNDAGEQLLSRDVRDIAKSHQADIAVVGTWSDSNAAVYVTLKAVRTDTNVIVASSTFSLKRSKVLPPT